MVKHMRRVPESISYQCSAAVKLLQVVVAMVLAAVLLLLRPVLAVTLLTS